MAKGRKLTTSRSERLLGNYSYGHHTNGTAGGSELGEDDVWSMVDNMADRDEEIDTNSQNEWNSLEASQINGSFSIRNGGRLGGSGGLSLAFDESDRTASPRIVHQFRGNDVVSSPRGRGRHLATSAPVNVPDWSKILRVNSLESLPDSEDGLDDPDSEIMPPHEYLARSRNKATTSVFEGVGRTLKGRDMRRVRDAVWSQTGFDG